MTAHQWVLYKITQHYAFAADGSTLGSWNGTDV